MKFQIVVAHNNIIEKINKIHIKLKNKFQLGTHKTKIFSNIIKKIIAIIKNNNILYIDIFLDKYRYNDINAQNIKEKNIIYKFFKFVSILI